MTRRVFFSFHYDDVMRVQQIRQMGAFVGKEVVRFEDKAAYEKVKKQGDAAIKQWIRNQLNGTSVTVVLIGTDTWKRPYVRYEIEQSYLRGNGLLGIHINGLRDVNRRTKQRGANPFEFVNNPEPQRAFDPWPIGTLARLFAQPSKPSHIRPWSARSAANMPPSTLAEHASIYPHSWVTEDYAAIKDNIGDWIETAARDVGR